MGQGKKLPEGAKRGESIWFPIGDDVYQVVVPFPISTDIGGGLGVGWEGVKAEAEKKNEIKVHTYIWDHGMTMSPDLWDEKRKIEVFEETRRKFAAMYGVSPENVKMATLSGIEINVFGVVRSKWWKKCLGCGEEMPAESMRCPKCGKECKPYGTYVYEKEG